MRTHHLLMLLIPLALVFSGCGPRHTTMRDVSTPDTGALKGQQIDAIYIVPFATTDTELSGDHGDTPTRTENLTKWAPHVAVAAADYVKGEMPGTKVIMVGEPTPYSDELFEKADVEITFVSQAPAEGIVTTGKHTSAREVSGAARFFLGGMSGKTWTRCVIDIQKDGEVVYAYTIDGKYTGGGWSLGYETLGANESIGTHLAETIHDMQKGELEHKVHPIED